MVRVTGLFLGVASVTLSLSHGVLAQPAETDAASSGGAEAPAATAGESGTADGAAPNAGAEQTTVEPTTVERTVMVAPPSGAVVQEPAPQPSAAAVPDPRVTDADSRGETQPDPKAPEPAAPPAAPEPCLTLAECLESGKPIVQLRLRYERFEDTAFPKPAYAVTLRTSLGYESRPFHGFSALGQLASVNVIGRNAFFTPGVPDRAEQGRSLLADTPAAKVQQAYLHYANSFLDVKLGRQEMVLNDMRFIGNSAWRQHVQSIDSARADLAMADVLSVTYGYLRQVQRVFGPESALGHYDTSAHVFNLVHTRPERIRAAAYGLLLEVKNLQELSTNTFGLRMEGPVRVSPNWEVLYAIDAAYQFGAYGNPNRVRAAYYMAELGVAFRGFGLKLHHNVREGHGDTNKFSTPLTNPWDGQIEHFTATPADGLRTVAAMLNGPIPGISDVTLKATYYNYWASRGTLHYGQEIDAAAEYKLSWFTERLVVGVRTAYYKRDELKTDATRFAGYTAYMY